MTSSTIQLANDRPTALNDDLYQWAVDAEQMLRDQDAAIQLAHRKAQRIIDAYLKYPLNEEDVVYAMFEITDSLDIFVK